jgi:hypothetical protein
MKRFIVIHGVAGEAPGTLATRVADAVGIRYGRQQTVLSEGRSFVEVSDNERSVLEVNWTDIRTASASVLGVLRHVLYMMTTMVDVAAKPLTGISAYAVSLYRAILFAATPGAVTILIMGAVAFTVEATEFRELLLLSIGVAFVGVTLYLQRFGGHFRWLWLWLIPMLALIVASIPRPIDKTSVFVPFLLSIRATWFLAMILSLDFAVLAEIVHWRKRGIATQATYVALLYMPYLIVNAVTTWATLLCMGYLARFPLYPRLENLSPLPGMDLFERAATIVFAGLAVLAFLLPAVAYIWPKNLHGDSVLNRRGHGAQQGMLYLLAIAPIALFALELYLFFILRIGAPSSKTVLQIYELSVLRTLPLLGWVVGPFSVALRFMGEVLFFLEPNPLHPASIREECLRRLSAAVHYVRQKHPGEETVILAHSQGSVIAAELRRQGKLPFMLVTLGSPVSSFYERFLGIDLVSDGAQWINVYRDGDYIAGPIAGVPNKNIGLGGHTGYWEDDKFARIIPDLMDTVG